MQDHLEEREREIRVADNPQERDLLALYIRQISRHPLLTALEEREIGRKADAVRRDLKRLAGQSASGTLPARELRERRESLERILAESKNRMINGNLRLVISVAKKYQNRGVSLLDLIDEGNIGLIEAVERYDWRKGCRFSTYGTWWIKQAVIRALAENGKSIKIPIHLLNTIKKCYATARQLTQDLGREPSHGEIAEYLRMTPSRVDELIQLSRETASIDTNLADENMTKLGDLLPDTTAVEPFESVFDLALQDTIRMVLSKLNAREVQIIRLRFGLDGEGPLTLEETGKALGITRERVRQIQEKALTKLRHAPSSRELEVFIHR